MARKAKRLLSNIDFSGETSHIALVGPAVGGPANGQDYALVMKATDKFSPEFIEKASKVQVTMDINEFLVKFFHMYYEDAEVLAQVMGFETSLTEDATEDDSETETSEPVDYEDQYRAYIAEKVNNITIVKSVFSSENVLEAITELTEDEYLSLLQDQAVLEKALKKAQKIKKANKSDKAPAESETSTNASVENNVEPTGSDNLEKSMDEDIEKSAIAELQKAFDAQAVELQKALDAVKQFEEANRVAVEKAKGAKIVAAVKDVEKSAILTKAALTLSDEDFDAFVSTLESLTVAVEKSAMFEEQGASVDEDATPVKESAVAKAIKARNSAK